MTEAFRKSYETQQIEAALRALAIGETATYDTLSKASGKDISGSSPQLASARRILEREGGYVFSIIHKTGVKRLSDSEVITDTHGARARIAKKAKTAMLRLSNIQSFDRLTDDEKRQHQAHAVIYAAVAEKASSQSMRGLLPTVNINGQAMLSAIKEAAKK